MQIKKFKNLKILIMYNNNIEIIPKEIMNLSNLKKLDMSYNKLKIIPIEITKIKDFKSFDIFYNSYENINNMSIDCVYFQIKNLSVPLLNLPITMKEIRLYNPISISVKLPFNCKIKIFYL